MNHRVYWLARVLFPGMVDIDYDADYWAGYWIRFPNKWGNPMPMVWIGGRRGDLLYIWSWLVEQVKFRNLEMLARVLA